MKYLIIAISTFLLELVFPWYIIALVPFALCFIIPSSAFKDFIFSLLAIFLLWLAGSLIKDIPNHSILSLKIAHMFHLQFSWLLMLVSSMLGGLVAGLAGLSGNYLRDLIRV